MEDALFRQGRGRKPAQESRFVFTTAKTRSINNRTLQNLNREQITDTDVGPCRPIPKTVSLLTEKARLVFHHPPGDNESVVVIEIPSSPPHTYRRDLQGRQNVHVEQ